ncbi:MAG: hypothetical protein ACLQDQ_17545 [Myxococcaceae bacterium]
MQNLRDKLFKAGLVSADAVAETAEVPKPPAVRRAAPPAEAARPPGRSAKAAACGPLIPVRREPLLPKLPPLPGSREAQRLESRKQLEQDREVRERVSAALVRVSPGERTFYFVTRKSRLRRLELALEQAQALESGALAVVELPEPGHLGHALVPAATAESLLRDFPKVVRFFNRAGQPVGFLSEEELRTRQVSETEQAELPEAAPALREQG